MIDAARVTARGAYHALLELSPLELAAKLTLLTLLLSPVGDWGVRPIVLTLAVVGLLVP